MSTLIPQTPESFTAGEIGIFGPTIAKPERPMLARDADAMYWMARYVERAEHVARLLLVNSNLLIDVGDLAPALQVRQWQSLLTILRLPELPETPDLAAPLLFTIAKTLACRIRSEHHRYRDSIAYIRPPGAH